MNTQPSEPVSKKHLWQYSLIIVFNLLFATLLYTFLHESGHALLGLLFGAKITSFSVDFIGMSAHVGLDAAFTPLQQSLVSLGGFGLPLTLVVIFLLLAPRRGNALLEWVKVLTAIVTISSLLAWVILPWIYLAGGRPGDDSITFLVNTGLYPPVVSLGALALFLGAWAVFLGRVEGFAGLLERLRALPEAMLTQAARKTLAMMVLVFVLVLGVSLGLGAAFGTATTNFLNAPAEFTPVVTIPLSERERTAEAVYTFSLQQPSSLSLFFAMQGLTKGPLKIALLGPDGAETDFFTAGAEASGNFTVNPRDLALQPGQYQIVLTLPQDPGVLKIYQKIGPALSSP